MHKYAHKMKSAEDLVAWQRRLMKSVFFVGALLFHLLLFLMFATWVVFNAPEERREVSTFLPVSIRPPPPPAPPPPSGGEAVNHFEPTALNAPPPAMPTAITTSAVSLFQVKSVSVTIPNLPSSVTPPVGTGMTGHEAPGTEKGAGNPFGSLNATGAAQLQGYLYDLKQTPDHKATQMDPGKYHNTIKQFIAGRWDPALFRNYYKSAKPLNTSSIFIPTIKAVDGPKAFGVENEVLPNMYVIWYKVTASSAQNGTFHFVGLADDILLVRVNGKTVLDASDRPVDDELRKKQQTYDTVNFKPTWEGDSKLWVGPPFQARSGDPLDIDVIIGEEPGGASNYFLYLQRDESTYQKQANNTPLLPVFQIDTQCLHPAGEAMSYPPFSSCLEPWQATSKL